MVKYITILIKKNIYVTMCINENVGSRHRGAWELALTLRDVPLNCLFFVYFSQQVLRGGAAISHMGSCFLSNTSVSLNCAVLLYVLAPGRWDPLLDRSTMSMGHVTMRMVPDASRHTPFDSHHNEANGQFYCKRETVFIMFFVTMG